MLRRVNPIVLLSLAITFILSIGVLASAQMGGGGSPGDAVAIATAQVGKPYAFGTDGPDTFSCAGLMRYALRNAGVDDNAPWGHEEYLSVYPNDPTPQVGDVVVYADGVAMYIGGDTVVMANAADGVVGTYPMNSIGTPLGFANPYGGAATPEATDPTLSQQTADPAAVDPTVVDPTVEDPAMPIGQTELDPAVVDPAALDRAALDPAALDPAALDPALADPALGDPALGDTGLLDLGTADPAALDPLAVDPAAVDPMMLTQP